MHSTRCLQSLYPVINCTLSKSGQLSASDAFRTFTTSCRRQSKASKEDGKTKFEKVWIENDLRYKKKAGNPAKNPVVLDKDAKSLENKGQGNHTESSELKNLDPPQNVFREPLPAELGPGASKNGTYKVPEYYSFTPFSYFEMEIVMANLRIPQPVAKSKKDI